MQEHNQEQAEMVERLAEGIMAAQPQVDPVNADRAAKQLAKIISGIGSQIAGLKHHAGQSYNHLSGEIRRLNILVEGLYRTLNLELPTVSTHNLLGAKVVVVKQSTAEEETKFSEIPLQGLIRREADPIFGKITVTLGDEHDDEREVKALEWFHPIVRAEIVRALEAMVAEDDSMYNVVVAMELSFIHDGVINKDSFAYNAAPASPAQAGEEVAVVAQPIVEDTPALVAVDSSTAAQTED